jgi:hypothetical protein
VTRKHVITGLAALVAAALILLLLSTRDPSTGPSPDPTTAAGRRRSAAEARAPELPGAEPSAPSADDSWPGRRPAPVIPSGPMLSELLGDARRRVREAAAACPRPPSMTADERYMFTATIALRSGTVAIRALQVDDSNLSDPALATCLEHAITSLTWSQSGPDRALSLTDTLSADLFR